MPYVEGNFHRSAGQGYAREKAKMQGEQSSGEDTGQPVEGDKGAKGSVLHVKHHGGGKFSSKDDSGQVMNHESLDDLHGHMAQHFGVSESQDMPAEEDSGEYEMGGDDPLKSILG